MKKLFLIPLMACFSCVMAWGVNVSTWAGLKAAIANPNAAITLTASVTCDEPSGSVIDFNGATINCGGSKAYNVAISTQGELTWKNATFTNTATAISLPAGNGLVMNFKNITIGNTVRIGISPKANTLNFDEDCNIICGGTIGGAASYGFSVGAGGGTVINNHGNIQKGIYAASKASVSDEVTLNNYGTYVQNTSFKAIMHVNNYAGSSFIFAVAGDATAKFYIKGTEYVVYNATPNGTVISMDPVAMIDETEYYDFNEAFKEATEGQTIKLLRDIPAASTDATTQRTVAKNITIDGQGHSINRRFIVSENKTLTLTGGVTVANTYIGSTDKSTILLNNGSTLVLSKATLAPGATSSPAVRTTTGAVATVQLADGTTNTIDAVNVHCFYAALTGSMGSLTIVGNGTLDATQSGTTGNVFSANTSTGGLYILNAPNAHFTARTEASLFYVNTGNSSIKAKADITAGYYNFMPTKDFIHEGYAAINVGSEYKVFELNAATASEYGFVASCNGEVFATLAAAVEAASENAEITLWADAPATTIAKSLVIKSNGYNASAISAGAGYARAAIDGGYAFGKVNKEGNVYTVSTFDELLFAANYAAVNGDIIRFANDIAYTTNGVDLIDITKSITIEGQGYTLSGYGKYTSSAYPAIMINGASQSNETEVTFKDLTISNPCKISAYYCRIIQAKSHVAAITLDNVNLIAPNGTKSNARGIQLDGATGWSDKTLITIKDSKIDMGYASYCITSFSPYILNATNSTFDAWNFATMKDAQGGEGSRGSILNFDACAIQTINPHSGYSNDYEIFSIQDDGITINLNNCTTNAVQLGDQTQAVFDLNPWQLDDTRRVQPVVITISGDNSNIQGILSQNYWAQGFNSNKTPEQSDDYLPDPAFTYTITITGGTYGFNPTSYPEVVIPSGYEVKQIETQQGATSTTLYRVRKTITTSESINDNVEGQGAGVNANTEFLISGDETVAADATVAHYVEVSNDATLTLPAGKELTVKNGLDVTDGAVLDVKAGSTLIVGEGGVTAESVNSIVVEADENGSASFLLDPEVIVNTTPNITIKMTAKGVGYEMDEEEQEYYWFRFAAPVAGIEAVDKWVVGSDPAVGRPTYFYKWNYAANEWSSIDALSDLEPFQGFSLTTNHEGLEDVTYTFKGRLAGNQDMKLQFQSRGYNYFGNSYTGYIDVLALVQQLMENDAIDGTVYMWDNEHQKFQEVPIGYLADEAVDSWKRQVAPMQTFILRQVNTGEPTSTTVNYASAIWGNPRYGLVSTPTPSPAPKRVNSDVTKMTIVVTSANGKIDEITFKESDVYSDEYEKGFDAVKFMNERQINLYTTIDNENLGYVATDNIEGKLISMQTVKALNYTMSFENVNGKEYAIRDNATGKVIAIEEGATYEFAAQPNSTVEGRFEIVSVAKMPTAIENTEVKANVKGIYTLTGQYVGEDFKALPAGVYVVNGVKIVK